MNTKVNTEMLIALNRLKQTLEKGDQMKIAEKLGIKYFTVHRMFNGKTPIRSEVIEAAEQILIERKKEIENKTRSLQALVS